MESKDKKKNVYLFVGIFACILLTVVVIIACCIGILVPSILAIIYAQLPNKLEYEQHQKMVYSLSGEIRSKGTEEQNSRMRIDSTCIVHCIIDDKEHKSYVFQMNLFETYIYNTTAEDQMDLLEYVNGSFGEYLFFNQSRKGKINEVIKPIEEDELFGLKLNIINSFQTSVPTGVKLRFFDTNGIFKAKTSYSIGSGLEKIVKTKVSQKEFEKFSDPDVAALDSQLFRYNTKMKHHITKGGKIRKIKVESDTTYTGKPTLREGEIQSMGSIVLELDRIEIENIFPPLDFQNGTQSVLHIFDINNDRREIEFWEKGDLSELGEYLIFTTKAGKFEVDTHLISLQLVSDLMKPIVTDDDMDFAVATARKLVYLYKQDYSLFENHFAPLFPANFTAQDITHKDLMLYVISVLGTSQCQTLLDVNGLTAVDDDVRFISVLSSRNIENPENAIMTRLQTIYSSDANTDIRNAALLSYAILSKRVRRKRREAEDYLMNLLRNAYSSSKEELMVILLALKNAEMNIDDVDLMYIDDFRNAHLSKVGFSLLKNEFRRENLRRNVKEMYNNLTFPYNKSNHYEKRLGGKYASAEFYAGYFVGSDYFCSYKDYFNYKAKAEAYADASVLGMHKRLFWGKGHYESVNGVQIANELKLDLWEKTIYYKSIPYADFDCNWHEKPIWHTSYGFSVSYTVVIVFVPVTFQAGADLVMDLKWSYRLCDDSLEAGIAIIPSAKLVVYGNAHINLLLIKGGVELACDINCKLFPNAYVSGQTCVVGIDVDLIVEPFNLNFYLFYQKRKCKYKFPFKLKCSWGSKKKKILFSHSQPTVTKKLFTKQWSIREIIRRDGNLEELPSSE